ESLGEKETGAKAALPIWMRFMRAAIAGKPDEVFPGDDESNQLLKAEAKPPANAPPTPLASGKPVQSTPANKPVSMTPLPPGTVAPAKAVVQPGAKPVAKLTEATDDTPRVKPALATEPVTTSPRGRVKPAIDGP